MTADCRKLTCGSNTTMSSFMDHPFDLRLASDVLYHLQSNPALVETIHTALAPQGGTILLAVRWRKPEEEREFFTQTTNKGIVLWTLHTCSHLPCLLYWQDYGHVTSTASHEYLAHTMVAVQGKPLALADITEEQVERMGDEEHQAWERAHIQIYMGRR